MLVNFDPPGIYLHDGVRYV